jgi:transcriptional repressor NrdR
MKCPKCGELEDKVIDSRPARDGLSVRRRRECLSCAHRFTTYEYIEQQDLRVVKRDGSLEPFSREKVATGIERAFEKRNTSRDTIAEIVDEVVAELKSTHESEVHSREIGAVVMAKLHASDEVAYMRYASVHRQFHTAEDFVEEASALEKKVRPNRLQAELFGGNQG